MITARSANSGNRGFARNHSEKLRYKKFVVTLLLILPLSAGINFVQQNNKTVSPSSTTSWWHIRRRRKRETQYCGGGVERYQCRGEISHR